jgi:hypothetical protein
MSFISAAENTACDSISRFDLVLAKPSFSMQTMNNLHTDYEGADERSVARIRFA